MGNTKSNTLLQTLLCADALPIELCGNDKRTAVNMSYRQMNSPSLTGLMKEKVRICKTAYKQSITFINLSAQEILDNIGKTNKAYGL